MQLLARGWLIYEMTASPLALGIVTAGWGLPMILFSFFGGAIADRVSKRPLLMATEAISGGISLMVAILIAMEMVTLWHLVAAAFLNGVALSFNNPARQSYIPQLVKGEWLMNAFALTSASWNLTRILAPALAGLLVALIGVAGTYFFTVGLYVLTVLSVAMISHPGTPEQNQKVPLSSDLAQGWSYIRNTFPLPHLLVFHLAVVMLAMPYIFLLPVFAVDVLQVGEVGLGWMMSTVGVGAILGNLAIATMGNFRRKGVLLVGLALLSGLALVLFSLSRSLPLSLGVLLGVGLGNASYLALNQVMLMSLSLPEMRGRVASLTMVSFGFTPLGILPISALAEVWGAPPAVGAGAMLLVLLSLLAFITPLRTLK